MHAPSPLSPGPSFPSVTVVSASAGSGKTHALTMRYVQLLLSPGVPHADLQNILAITFTNNAAKEMRQRILDVLKEIALGISSERMTQVQDVTGLPPGELRTRAGAMIDQILRRYTSFQIRTIDSFVARVFKASSFEFGFSPDVEIVMDSSAFVTKALDIVTRGDAEGDSSPRLLLDLLEVMTAVRHGDRPYLWNPYGEMLSEVQRLYARLCRLTEPLHRPGDPTRLRRVALELENLARRLHDELLSIDVPVNRLFLNDLQLVLERGWYVLVSRTRKLEKFINRKRTKAQQEALDVHGTRLSAMVTDFYDLLRQAVVLDAETYYRPYADVIALLQGPLASVHKSQGALPLEDVNRLLVDHLAAEAVPEVYFSLGERIFHYCIDEFQDTSPMQWAVLLPLILNTVSEDGSLFLVGDMKQSIYGFRGADWNIMRSLVQGDQSIPSAPTDVRRLEINRRSGEGIVQFVEGVFARISASDTYRTAAAGSGLDDVHQEVTSAKAGKGYVEVLLLSSPGNGDGDSDPPAGEEQYAERDAGLEIVTSALARGYAPGDIALLAPGNATVVEVSSWLNAAGIDFLSHSSLDIRNRKIVGELLACLRFLDSPIDSTAFATFLLGDLFGSAIRARGGQVFADQFRELIAEGRGSQDSPLYKRFLAAFTGLWNDTFGDLLPRVGHLPLYDLLCELYKMFDPFSCVPEEEGALARLLEVVHEFEQTGQNSLRDFLSFATDEAGDSSPWDLDPPSNASVVHVMTIHKSKGLQFPVVVNLLASQRIIPDAPLIHHTGDGAALLRVTADMAEHASALAEIREQHLESRTTDALNLLYVGLTRAMDELYVVCTHTNDTDYLSLAFPEAVGSPRSRPRLPRWRSKEQIQMSRCFHHVLPRPRDLVRGGGMSTEQSLRGEYLHALLAQIPFVATDAKEQISRAWSLLPPGQLTIEEARGILGPFLEHPDIVPYFVQKGGRTVEREKELVDRSGALLRVDRMILDTDGILIVDFKTGGERQEAEYIQQVEKYLAVARDIYPNRAVRGVVAYIDLCKRVEVA